jgi:hypothetical protein
VRRRAAGEDVENQSCAVDDFDVERALEIALLGRREIIIDQDDIVVDVVTA